MALHLYSEPYRPEGNIDARATKRAIGRPRMDNWAVFLRETVQNSWDAKLPGVQRISFAVDAIRLDATQLKSLRSEIFETRPRKGSTLAATIRTPVSLLLVTDRGTRGLQGPTRADRTATEKADFADFVRNIGRAEEKELGGGTYGFGKGVLFDASSCSTILLFSRTTFGGRPVSRFMAISLGLSYDTGGLRYTGRHWWGVENPDTGAEPVTGREAERLAASVGMTTVPRGETGTVLAVVAPQVEDADLDSVVQRIADAATWWAWPHMVGETEGGTTIDFSFSSEGRPLAGPDPFEHPALRHFVGAYRRACRLLNTADDDAEEWPWVAKRITSARPYALLGSLSYRKYQESPDLPSPAADHTQEIRSHVALMRNPRLVVRYWEAPADPNGQGTAGVFIANPRKNTEFALSEPVAHDDWVPDNLQLQKYERNPVKIALDRVRTEFKQAARNLVPIIGTGSDRGATRLAGLIGGLLTPGGEGIDVRVPGVAGDRSGSGRRGSGGSGNSGGQPPPPAPKAGRATVTGDGVLRRADDGLEVDFPVTIQVGMEADLRVTAVARVVLDGGVPEDPEQAPIGAEVPVVVGWLDKSTGAWLCRTDAIEIGGPSDVDLAVRVRQPNDVAVTVQLSSEALL